MINVAPVVGSVGAAFMPGRLRARWRHFAATNGSLIEENGKVVSSALIGQAFDDPKYFWGRPSATSPQPYNGAASSGSNQGPTNPALADAVRDRIKALRDSDPGSAASVPADPEISIAAAEYQLARVAKARGIQADAVRLLVSQNTASRTFGLLGEPRVNVVKLNLALDNAAK